MKIAYFDCASGISGDMTLGALVDAGVPLAEIQAAIDSLGLPDCRLVASEVKRKGFRATKIDVEHAPEHAHRHLSDITKMIDGSSLTGPQRALATEIFTHIGKAEAKVHGTTIEKVHFHEVGAVDSIADIVGTAVGWNLLGVERAQASPVPTGTGFIEIAHGRCSLPAPATAELLAGIPLAASDVEAELTTPTGAAIISTLAAEYGPLPAMRIKTIGYGAGSRDFDSHPNILRLIVGEAIGPSSAEGTEQDVVALLETNLDDVSGEVIGHTLSQLMDAGALDAFATPIQMKKNRPGVLLSVICRQNNVAAMETILFCETTTLGIRRRTAQRSTLRRKTHTVNTPLGEVQGVVAQRPGEVLSFSPEYEACRQLAETKGVSLQTVYDAARAAFDPKNL